MTPELVLSSVPHSGTRFVEKIFTDHRPRWHVIGLNGQPNPTPTVFEGHMVKPGLTQRVIELSKRMPVVVPLRHPFRVEQSWLLREDRNEISQLWEAFDNLLGPIYDLGQRVTYMPIDASVAVRTLQEMKLCDTADAALEPQWDEKVNSKAETWRLELGDIEPSDRARRVAEHPLFERFYRERHGGEDHSGW